MTNIIGFTAKKDLPKDEPSTFDLAIIPDSLYVDSKEACPHCHSTTELEMLDYVENLHGLHLTLLFADLLRCEECTQHTLVVEYPALKVTKPIITRWTINSPQQK